MYSLKYLTNKMICENCSSPMIPIRFVEDEYHIENGRQSKTGRRRYNVSHFECQICGHKEAVDDTFASDWF